MSPWFWALLGVGAFVLLGLVLLTVAFLWLGRNEDARALAGFVPDCIVLFTRLLRDPGVSRSTTPSSRPSSSARCCTGATSWCESTGQGPRAR